MTCVVVAEGGGGPPLAADLGTGLELAAATGTGRILFPEIHESDAGVASSREEAREKVVDFSNPYGIIPITRAAPAHTATEEPEG